MKEKIKAKELMIDPICGECGCKLISNDIVVVFQDKYGHDLVNGYYCEKCAEYIDIEIK